MTAPIFPLPGKRVFVAGHRGMVGDALVRRLTAVGCEILTVDRAVLDLTHQQDCFAWLAETRPDAVIVAAAKVGGIKANAEFPADFIYQNLAIETNLIEGARRAGVAKLLFLGSSCIYPRLAPQPIGEDALLSGPLEPTNEWYAIAKIAGLKLCQAYRRQYGVDFITAMPTNLYGPGDNFTTDGGHVFPALLRRIYDAEVSGRGEVEIWGSGTPRREFLFVDDLADACLFLMEHYSGDVPLNIGTGADLTIRELAELIAKRVGWRGRFTYLTDKPDGTPRKLLDVSAMRRLGWTARTPLEDGIDLTYRWFLDHQDSTNRPK